MNVPVIPEPIRTQKWLERLAPYIQRAEILPELVVEGQLSRMVGLTLEAVGCRAAIGSRCKVQSKNGQFIEAEVVGFAGDCIFLMPSGNQVLDPVGCPKALEKYNPPQNQQPLPQ